MKGVKDTYTDEALEMIQDSCTTARDLAIIDLLASSGMHVGKMSRSIVMISTFMSENAS